MRKSERIILLLVLLQAISVVMLWSLTSLTRTGQEVFSLFLAVDLLSLALVSRVYRTTNGGGMVEVRWIIFAGIAMLALLFTALFVP